MKATGFRLVARGIALAAGLCVAASTQALMAGSAPDSPAARVEPNVSTSAFTSAVSISIGSGVYSGVVVAPRYVLTAAHVAAGSTPEAVSVQVNATSVPVVIGASAIHVFPGASFPYDDLALIELATAVPPTVHIPPIYQQPLVRHQGMTLVGYGSSANGDSGAFVGGLAGVKRSGRNAIDAVQSAVDSSGRTSLFYLFDFDGPSGNGVLGGATLGNALETGLSVGDSGSPAYASIGGQVWLIGIDNLVFTTNGTGADFRFGTGGGGMLLSDPRFIAWLRAQTADTLGGGTEGEIPMPTWAGAALAVGLAAPLLIRRRRSRARLTSSGSPG